jgi:hypothetical protein
MTALKDDYFEQFGFLALRKGEDLELTYGIVEDITSRIELPAHSHVLFSIVHYGKEIRQTVTPPLLNMASEPPFTITLASEKEIVNLFDGHRKVADSLDFPHERVAQYLTLWHLARAADSAVDPEIVSYLTRSEMEWARKIYTVVDPVGEGARLTPSVRKVRADPRRTTKSERRTVAWRIED